MLIFSVTTPEKFEKLLWGAISTLFSIVAISLGVYFTYLVLLYSFS